MNNWCRIKDMYCSEATINGYCPTALCNKAKCYQTNGKDHSDYGFPFHIPEVEPIVITSDAVFIKPLKLVVLTEDVYNKLKEK